MSSKIPAKIYNIINKNILYIIPGIMTGLLILKKPLMPLSSILFWTLITMFIIDIISKIIRSFLETHYTINLIQHAYTFTITRPKIFVIERLHYDTNTSDKKIEYIDYLPIQIDSFDSLLKLTMMLNKDPQKPENIYYKASIISKPQYPNNNK